MNKKERVQPKEGEDKKDSFIAEINAGCTAPIRIVQLDLKKFNNNLIKTVKDNVGPLNYKSNVKGEMTDWYLNNRYIERLHQLVEENMPIQPASDENWNVTLKFIDTWGAIYKHQDYCNVHHHWPYTWSWIYYAQVDDKSSPLILYNIMKENNTEIHNIALQPKTGQLIIFPSFVTHGVDKTQGLGEDEWRIVIAGNIMYHYEKK